MSNHNSRRNEEQSESYHSQDYFSLKDAVLIVDTEQDAHAAREHLGMEAFVYSHLPEQR
jgi:hypothetical protein